MTADGDGFFWGVDANVLELDGGGCTTHSSVNLCMSPNHRILHFKQGDLMVCKLHSIKLFKKHENCLRLEPVFPSCPRGEEEPSTTHGVGRGF